MAGERRTKQGKDAERPISSAIWPTEDAAMRSVRRRQACAAADRVTPTKRGSNPPLPPLALIP